MNNQEDIKKIVIMSLIFCTKEETQKISLSIKEVLDYISQLQKIFNDKKYEISIFDMTLLQHNLKNIMRDDIIVESDSHDKILNQAPYIEKNFFTVPAIVNKGKK